MQDDQNRNAFQEVLGAGQCCHPIRLRGETRNRSTGEISSSQIKIACKDRREKVCASCSQRYGTDAWIIAVTGIGGGKEVPESVSSHPRIFVTVTAPSFGRVHSEGEDVCSPARTGLLKCSHGGTVTCLLIHEPNDQLIGKPLCEMCFDSDGVVNWNVYSSKLWSKTVQYARRFLAREVGVSQRKQAQLIQVHYFKVAEVQRRGLIHFHAIVRLDDLRFQSGELEGSDLANAWRKAIKATTFSTPAGEIVWGRIYDIREIDQSLSSTRRTASYLAKYVTKTTGESIELARRFRSEQDIRNLVKDKHYQELALATWRLGADLRYQDLNLDRYANTMGYRGHIITKSRGYSTSFSKLRQSRIDYVRSQVRSEVSSDVTETTYLFDGRGYDHANSEQIAETLATMHRDLRVEKMKRQIDETTI